MEIFFFPPDFQESNYDCFLSPTSASGEFELSCTFSSVYNFDHLFYGEWLINQMGFFVVAAAEEISYSGKLLLAIQNLPEKAVYK